MSARITAIRNCSGIDSSASLTSASGRFSSTSVSAVRWASEKRGHILVQEAILVLVVAGAYLGVADWVAQKVVNFII